MGDALAAAKQERGMPVPKPAQRRSAKRRTKAKSR
jgi:hypothetical protein